MTTLPATQPYPGETAELTDDATPPAMVITARLTTRGGIREMSVTYQHPEDMPDDDKAVEVADDLSRRVWGDRSGLGQRPQAEITRDGEPTFLPNGHDRRFPRDRNRGDRRRR